MPDHYSKHKKTSSATPAPQSPTASPAQQATPIQPSSEAPFMQKAPNMKDKTIKKRLPQKRKASMIDESIERAKKSGKPGAEETYTSVAPPRKK